VDALLAAGWAECGRLRALEVMRQQRDEQAERYQRLRIGVIGLGLNPDEISPPPWRPPPPG
jgi:hypothetical protein